MKTIEEMQVCWKKANAVNAPFQLDKIKVDKLVQRGIRKEQRKVLEYLFALFVWQVLIYAYLTHVVVRAWGNWPLISTCIFGIFVYLPFTIIFIKKLKRVPLLSFNKPDFAVRDIYSTLVSQHQQLSSFYKFKARFDILTIPVCGVVITMLFSWYKLIPPVSQHVLAAVITFFITIAAFTIATIRDNRQRFAQPLKQLELAIADLQKDGE